MKTRITRDEMCMLSAHVASHRGTCNRLHVGALLTLDSRPISWGYNGTPAGQPHCGPECNSSTPCTKTLHAERNALHWASKHLGAIPPGCTLYVTDSPCLDCAKLIVLFDVKRVVYDREYRIRDGINHLTENGVEVVQCQVDLVISASFAHSLITPASEE